MVDDDFFGDQDDNTLHTERQRRHRELEAIRRPHYIAGVRQGVSDAHEANLQTAFDSAFLDAATAVAYPSYLHGVASTVAAFYAKHGCYARSEQQVQRLDDTEVPTHYLRSLQASVTKLRADIRQLAIDGRIEVQSHVDTLSKVSLVQPPSDLSDLHRQTSTS